MNEESFSRRLQHITNLFFADATVSFTPVERPTMISEFEVHQQDNEVSRLSVTTIYLNGNQDSYHHEKTFQSGGAADQQFKTAVAHVFVLMLQDVTGMRQKWGILTGIRPTKLLHQKLRAGMTKAEAHQQLKNDYLISDEKITLMQQVVDRQLVVVPDLYDLQNEVSIYIGIPFCPTKCAYCTFPAYAIHGRQGSVPAFLDGLQEEIEIIGSWLKENNVAVTTVYFGGGTPTSISADEMDKLYEKMSTSIPKISSVREITVEAGRPDTITAEKLAILKKWGIDRISINPQTYTDETLTAIGRHHSVAETIEKFYLAREMGINNINMDLIIGLPGEGLQEVKHSLSETSKLNPDSITVHTLSFKRASEMTRNKLKYPVASSAEIDKMMDASVEWTEQNGYYPYYLYRQKNILGNLENVGYAHRNKESIYNIIIMEEQQTIIGLGCGASSKFVHPQTRKITRYANPKEPRAYENNYKQHIENKLTILKELYKK